jgi:hypothetical protein
MRVVMVVVIEPDCGDNLVDQEVRDWVRRTLETPNELGSINRVELLNADEVVEAALPLGKADMVLGATNGCGYPGVEKDKERHRAEFLRRRAQFLEYLGF